jgi:hypothetical protein
MQIPIHQTTTTAFYTLISAVGRRMQNFSKAEAARVSFSVSITEINALVIHPILYMAILAARAHYNCGLIRRASSGAETQRGD